jgi:hypothetical protein
VQVIKSYSSSAPEATEQAKNSYLDIDFYTTDGTALKTIVRSNPGDTLENGVITGKSHWNDLEDLDL